jgi:hypothetical protein
VPRNSCGQGTSTPSERSSSNGTARACPCRSGRVERPQKTLPLLAERVVHLLGGDAVELDIQRPQTLVRPDERIQALLTVSLVTTLRDA